MRALPLLPALLTLACSSTVQAGLRCHDAVARSGPVTVEVVDAVGRRLPGFDARGEVWVLGHRGDRYRIRVGNDSGERVEVVVSVDGRDAIDGRPATWSKRGYLVPAGGEVVIDGFRISSAEVAAFRFSSVAESYAAKTGSARDVGVIGVAVFREAHPPRPWPIHPWWGRKEEGDKDDNQVGDAERSGARPGTDAPAPPAEATAPSPSGKAADVRREGDDRSGLGTAFGERRSSPVREVPFARASSSPDNVVAVHYDNEHGLAAQGIDLSCPPSPRPDAWLRRTAKPFAEASRPYATPPPGWDD